MRRSKFPKPIAIAPWMWLACSTAPPTPGPALQPTASGPSVAPAAVASAPHDAPPSVSLSSSPAQGIGLGSMKGVVRFAGTPPKMRVPKDRYLTDFCKSEPIPSNAVIVEDGGLVDTFVALEAGSVPGPWPPRQEWVELDEVHCMHLPRIQGLVVGQEVHVVNQDPTLHNVHAYRGSETLFNFAQPKGAAPVEKRFDDPGIIRFTSDVYPWIRSFVIVMDHPFFTVSGARGAFRIDRVPEGRYTLLAWHARYGKKTQTIEIRAGEPITVTFTYDGKEPAPPDNPSEPG